MFLDNWALIHAQQLALTEKLPLHVCVCLHVPKSELSTLRHYSFMLKGLEEVAEVSKDCAAKSGSKICLHAACVHQECKALDIQFHLLRGAAEKLLAGFVSEHQLGAVVTDFSPLREPLKWLEDIKKKLPKDIPLIQVDAFAAESLNMLEFCVSPQKDVKITSFSGVSPSVLFSGGRPQHCSLLGCLAQTGVRCQNYPRENQQAVAGVPHRFPPDKETSSRCHTKRPGKGAVQPLWC